MIDKAKAYKEINAWLDSKKDLATGIKLHYRYSTSDSDKMKVNKMSIPVRLKFIENKLTEICQFCQPAKEIKKPLIDETNKNIPVCQPGKIIKAVNKNYLTAEERLKSEFPQIVFRDLPDTLKLLVFDRFDAKRDAIEAHKQLHDATTDEERYVLARKCVIAMKNNWDIWEELNHWHQYNKVLGEHPKFKENEFIDEINNIESTKPATVSTKLFISIRTKARNNIQEYIRMKELTDVQEQKKKQWIWKYNIVSQKLNEPLWEK